jgi:hypothetical protein
MVVASSGRWVCTGVGYVEVIHGADVMDAQVGDVMMEALATNQAAPQAPVRSTFVTVVAWTFITIAGFASFIAVLQALMFAFVFPADLFRVPESAKGLEEMPAFFRFMFQHVAWFFAFFWTLSVVTLVCAIGLLRRKNWARVAFVAIMVLGIIWNLSGIWLQEQMMSSFPKPPVQDPRMAEFHAGFETMMTIMRFAMTAFAIAMSALFAWIIKRLVSRSALAEFGAL